MALSLQLTVCFSFFLLPKASFSSPPKKGGPAIRVPANVLSTENRVPHSLRIYIQKEKKSKVNSLQQNLFFQSLSRVNSPGVFFFNRDMCYFCLTVPLNQLDLESAKYAAPYLISVINFHTITCSSF